MNKEEYLNLLLIFKEMEDTKIDFGSSMMTLSNSKDHIHILHSIDANEVNASGLKKFIFETHKLNLRNINYEQYDTLQDLLDTEFENEFLANTETTSAEWYIRKGNSVKVGKEFWNRRMHRLISIGYKDN